MLEEVETRSVERRRILHVRAVPDIAQDHPGGVADAVGDSIPDHADIEDVSIAGDHE